METCGILGAKLTRDNTLNIVKLVIPKQKGDANSVEMLSEEELVGAILDEDFLILGWIHTHPQQTCFMSSIDVHTQCGYQVRRGGPRGTLRGGIAARVRLRCG